MPEVQYCDENTFLVVGFLEFSVGKFTYFVLSRRFPQEAVLRHISSNVTFLLFQIHSQYQNTTVSYTKVSAKDCFSKKSVSIMSSLVCGACV